MTKMSDVPFAERLEWLMQWEAHCKVRIHYCPFDQSYEVLFKHEGSDRWHEHIISDYTLKHDTLHHALAPLRTHIKMTKP